MSVVKVALLALRDADGATVIEYALIAALVSIAFIIALTAMGTSIDELFIYVADVLGDVASAVSGS